MTVSRNFSTQEFPANGATVAFSTDIEAYDSSEIFVFLISSDAVETQQVENTNYTVSGIKQSSDDISKVTVTFNTAPDAGTTIRIRRRVIPLQPVKLMNNDGFYPEVLERQLDRIVMMVQQNESALQGEFFASASGAENEMTMLTIPTVTIPLPIQFLTTSGYASAGDYGYTKLKRVSSEPGHPLKIQDASGAWFEEASPDINPAAWGLQLVDIDYSYDVEVPAELSQRTSEIIINNQVLANCSDAAKALSTGVYCNFIGKFYHSDPYLLPDVDTNGVAWDRNHPTFYRGKGRGLTISAYKGTDCAVKQETYGTSIRGQVMGPVIEGMTFEGPQSFSNPADVIKLSNGRSTRIRRNYVFGFHGGDFIVCQPSRSGGNFGMLVEDNLVSNEEFVYNNLSGATYYPLETLEKNAVRSFLRSEGPIAGSGKFNDVTIRKNRHMYPLLSFINGKGLGNLQDSGATGSMANLNSYDNVVFFEGSQKVQEGEVVGGSTTSANLRIDDFPAGNDLTGLEIGLFNPTTSRWEYRYIDTYTETGSPVTQRTVTWTDAVSFDVFTSSPAFAAKYRIAWANAEIRTNYLPGQAQHHIHWASDFTAKSDDYVEDAKRPAVIDIEGKHLLDLNMSRWVVRSGNGMVHLDGTPARSRWMQGVAPTGGEGQGANLGTQWILLQDAEIYNTDHETAVLVLKFNNTGQTLERGDVVMTAGSPRWNMIDTVNYTNGSSGANPAFVVVNPEGLPWLDQTWGPVAISGQVKIKVDGICDEGALLVKKQGNVAEAKQMRVGTDITTEITNAYSSLGSNPSTEELRTMLNTWRGLINEVIETTEVHEKFFARTLENKTLPSVDLVLCRLN